MVDIAAISGAMTALNSAMDIAKSIKSAADAAKINSLVIDLQSTIMQAQGEAMKAQQAQSTQVDQIRKLEEEVARLKAWDAEKEDYELKEVWRGAFAYMLKPDMRGSKPPHWLCQHCYENGKKSLMQHQGAVPTTASGSLFKCPTCNAAFAVDRRTPIKWL